MSMRFHSAEKIRTAVLAASLVVSAAGSAQAALSLGDMNCDGVVNGADVPLFVDCLLNGNCNVGMVDCDGNPANGCETNINTNVNNCGSCGHVCNLANATAACTAGVCTISSCNAGFKNCDGQTANGCETNINTSPNNCGGCGVVCPPRLNATATCVNGVCSFTCNAGFADCDGQPGTGCEVSLQTDPFNCGGCGNVCPSPPNATATCDNGVCSFTCNAGFADCDGQPGNGCEVNLQTDSSHCGNCGTVCPVGHQCVNGQCQ